MPTQKELKASGKARAFEMLYAYQQGASWLEMGKKFQLTDSAMLSHMRRHCPMQFEAARAARKGPGYPKSRVN